jgi:hypothetical protein
MQACIAPDIPAPLGAVRCARTIEIGVECVFLRVSESFSRQIVLCPPAHLATVPSLKLRHKFNADSRLTSQGHL